MILGFGDPKSHGHKRRCRNNWNQRREHVEKERDKWRAKKKFAKKWRKK